VLDFELAAGNVKVEYGYWAGTLRKWSENGLTLRRDVPESLLDGELIYAAAAVCGQDEPRVDHSVGPIFGLDFHASKLSPDLSPQLEERILKQHDEEIVFTDSYGITHKLLRHGATVPLELDTPVKTWADWEAYKQRYDDDYAGRLPADWDAVKCGLPDRDFPIRLGGNPFGFLGFPRHLMGTTNYLMALYDQPDLIHDINDFALTLVMNCWDLVLKDTPIDCAFVFEDMSYKTGSLISPEMFDQFLAPYYVRLIDFLNQHGVRHVLVDSDGLIEQLVPKWLEVGVTGVFPMEAVNDLWKFRQEYPRLQMLGGIDKRVLIEGTRHDIDRELEKAEALMKTGGYIPHIDHSVPMDADWERFKYYRTRLNEIIDRMTK
jgi:uroporphyrinogen decarboxylase